jgi:hypothetical protein
MAAPSTLRSRLRLPRERHLELAVGALVAFGAALFVFLELRPDLLFRDTTTNGGDTGAHVWWPAFMRDHVFPKWRLSGWAPDWYAGFPVGQFYFPLPALLISFLDIVLPYNVAFKLVTALGPVLLPIGAWHFARGLRAPWPAPALFAVATLPFLFFTGYTIYGGNLPSTLAGEFSFTIAFAVSLFFLGSLARALDERRSLWVPALLLAVVALTHIIAMAFAAVGAVILWASRRPVRNFRPAVAIAITAALLSAVWVLPTVARVAYATDMGWGKLTEFRTHLLHDDLRWAVILAGVALVAGAAYLRRATLELAALTAVFGLAFVLWPETRLWNARLLPFYYLPLMFLAAMGVTEIVNLLRLALVSGRAADRVMTATLDESGSMQVAPPAEEPDSAPTPAPTPLRTAGLKRASVILAHAVAVVALIGGIAHARATRDFIPGWISWNYEGYEAKAAYPEYHQIMTTLQGLPPGRLLWERLNSINNYGSDLALELIPYFTDGRIGSMEGLYFESAGTTPYHFLTVAEVASEPSNPVRGLQYGTINDDFDLGVRHLQLLGVRYYMAGSDQAKEKADAHPSLRCVALLGDPGRATLPGDADRCGRVLGDVSGTPHVAHWAIYEVQAAPVVQPLRIEPVVVTGVKPRGWTCPGHGCKEVGPAVDWWRDPDQHGRFLAAGGPPEWTRVAASRWEDAPRTALPEAHTSDVRLDDDSVRFRVDRTGVPVLVKVSYFPNWQVKGADGPWRISPNFMVVVPTSNEVELSYGRTPVDRLAIALTIVGVACLLGLARWRLRPLDDPA